MGLFEHWSKHIAFVVQIEDVVMSVINNNQGYNDMPPLRLYIKGAAGYSWYYVNTVAIHEVSSAESFEGYPKSY